MPQDRPDRLYFLDWARIGAFALLVLFHVGMYYVPWDWHVKSAQPQAWLEPVMMLSSPWRMGLLFLVSGAATSLVLARRAPDRPWLRQRSARLLLPLLLGVAVIVPPQAYLEVLDKHAYAGGYLDFLALYFTGHGGFCRDGNCLILPTWNHLWFLPYLWFYTLALWLALRRWPQALQALAAAAARALAGPGLWLVPITVLALARITLLSRFGSTHALVDDWHNHAVYLSLFLAGAALARQPGLFDRMAALRWPTLAAALLGWGLLVLYFASFDELHPPPEALRLAQRALWAAVQWSAILAVLGFGRRHLNVDHRWRAPLNEAVFPAYVLHQTVIVLAAVALRPLAWPLALEGPLLVLLTFGLSLAGWRLARRLGPLRPWMGLPARAPARRPSSATVGSSQGA